MPIVHEERLNGRPCTILPMIRTLRVRRGSSEPQTHTLDGDEIIIGRAASSTLAFPESKLVSRQHAAIRRRGDHWVLVDLGSSNGTLLNGSRVGGEAPLSAGDTIEVGDVTIEVTGDTAVPWVPPAPAAATPQAGAASRDQAAFEFPGRHGLLVLSDPTPFAYGRSSVLFRVTAADGRDLCVKLFPHVTGDSWDNVSYFEREVTAQIRLVHPHILPVVDFGLQSRPHRNPFVVFPFCAGGNLRTLQRERRYHPLAAVLPVLEQLAAALDHAHASGYVHGDVKPENMLFSADRTQAFLSDFGMSNVFAVQERFSTVIQGPQGGTTAYFSPEQISDNQQTPLSDIYAFALIAYELLTGHLPFDPRQPTFRQMLAKVQGELMDPRQFNPQIGDELRGALLAGLHVNPVQRPRSATQFCRMLASADSGSAAAVPSASHGAMVFVSYSHKDARWLERIRVHLRPLERKGLIALWDDTLLEPGRQWRDEIEATLGRTRCAVLLVSANFLASDFCTDIELPALLQRARDRGVRVLPLMISPCQLSSVPSLAALQSVNDPARTLVEVDRGEQERVLVALASAVRQALE
jgi:serine/threonine protein kinase